MNRICKLLILGILAISILSGCASPEPAPAAQPTSPVLEATDSPQEPAAATEAPEPTSNAPAPAAPPAAAPIDPEVAAISGQTLLEERCVTCHTLENITVITGSYEEWEIIVDRMIQRGANLTDEEKSILLEYLAENYKD